MENFTVSSCCVTCIVIFAVCAIVPKLLRLLRLYRMASKFGGPPGWPIIGNALLFVGDPEDFMKTGSQLTKTYPTPFRVWILHNLVFGLNTPEQCKAVCLSSKTADKGTFYEFIRPFMGTGLVTAPATISQAHRKLIAPTFHIEILQSFVGVFTARAVQTVKAMERELNGPEFRISDYIAPYALMSICDTTMGVNLEADNDSHDFMEAIKNTSRMAMERALRPWMYLDFIFNCTKPGKEHHKNSSYLHSFTANVIKKKREKILEHERQSNLADAEKDERKFGSGSGISTSPRRKAFLDHLLDLTRDNNTLSDEELRDEVNTMVAAGYDTTAIMVASVMMILASYPEVQEKVYAELSDIFEDYEGDELHVTWKNLKRMAYLECVIKETMRLFPTGPYLFRTVTDDVEIDGHIFPKGSQVVLGIIDLHRNEKYWPDPLKFDPDRFLPEEVAKRHPYSYLAFSAGLRNCIGSKYAMLSMKTVVATILWKYTLKKDNVTPVKDIRLKMEILMIPVEPFTMRIERRTRKDFSD